MPEQGGAPIMRLIWQLSTSISLALLLCATASRVSADQYYGKQLGFWQHDADNYKKLSSSIPSCATVWAENPDPFKPPVSGLVHFVRLYAQCRHALEARHATLGVLRANDVFLGTTCMALTVTSGGAADMPECNLKSYLPKPSSTSWSVSAPTKRITYKTSQSTEAFFDLARCKDEFNAMDDDAAFRRVMAADHAGRFVGWPAGTRVTVTSGNPESDIFVMAKDRKGRTGCIASAWLLRS